MSYKRSSDSQTIKWLSGIYEIKSYYLIQLTIDYTCSKHFTQVQWSMMNFCGSWVAMWLKNKNHVTYEQKFYSRAIKWPRSKSFPPVKWSKKNIYVKKNIKFSFIYIYPRCESICTVFVEKCACKSLSFDKLIYCHT